MLDDTFLLLAFVPILYFHHRCSSIKMAQLPFSLYSLPYFQATRVLSTDLTGIRVYFIKFEFLSL